MHTSQKLKEQWMAVALLHQAPINAATAMEVT